MRPAEAPQPGLERKTAAIDLDLIRDLKEFMMRECAVGCHPCLSVLAACVSWDHGSLPEPPGWGHGAILLREAFACAIGTHHVNVTALCEAFRDWAIAQATLP